jgi:hypothetical protein
VSAGLAQLRAEVHEESMGTDAMMGHLEQRVAALEAVVAARGLRGVRARVRLGRHLRASVRNFPGSTFAERRMEAAAADELAQQ